MTNDMYSSVEPAADFDIDLKQKTNQLKDLVDQGDIAGAMAVIAELNDSRDRTLYQEVGRLTRKLHESIRNFHIDTVDANNSAEISSIDDASDRLAYVIDMTNKAANRTLDLVEQTMPYTSKINQEAISLKADWDRLQRKEMKAEEFRALSVRMNSFLQNLSQDSDQVHQNLSDILLAQDFQDLTGQVINRVTALVKDVEENLVALVTMAGQVDRITGTVHEPIEQTGIDIGGEGPQMNADKRADVVAGQDDVDDLLSSLGF